MTMLAIRERDHHSYSEASELNLLAHDHLTSSHMIRQEPIGTEDLWASYFDGDDSVCEGLDLHFIQQRLIESENGMTSTHGRRNASRQQVGLDLSVGERFELDAESDRLREDRPTELATSDRPLSHPMSSPHCELVDKTKRLNITRACSHDRVLSGDTCCQSVSDYRSDDADLADAHNQSRGNIEDGRDLRAGHRTNEQLKYFVVDHSQQTLLDTLNQATEDLLRTPLTPISTDIVSERGFPLGVEVAKNAYGQGLLSTGSFYQDCLPPALSVPKTASSPATITEHRNYPTRADQLPQDSISPALGQSHLETRGFRPVVKRRNLSHDVQIKRIDQAPLSAIYEEPAGSQHACTCGLCSDSENGRGIVWFHLCPRYASIARQNGVTYEPCEGRIIMHHGPDRSSVGLIIEGPMEDRFIPATRPPRAPEVPEPNRVESPKPGKLDLRAMHSATGNLVRTLPRTTSGPKLHQLPAISTPALQRPISPATQVSYPTSLNPFYSVYCPKQGRDAGARDATHTFQDIVDQFPAIPSANPQENVHPAFRSEATLPIESYCSPSSKEHSHASTQNERFECPERLHRSTNYSDSSGGRPARSDSLGAPSHRGLCEEEYKSSIDHPQKSGNVPKHCRARHLTLSSSTASELSPFASHERTPSVFLGPSTPSTASFQRSSVSSYGDPLPSHVHEPKGAASPVGMKENVLASPFQPHQHSMDHDAHADSFSPPEMYYTAPSSNYAYSPPPETPQTPHTSISSLGRLRSFNPRQNSPFFETQGYLRHQASEQSFAQTLDSLQIRRDDGITSSTNLLNGHAFDNVDSRSETSGWRHEDGDADYDGLYFIESDNNIQSDHSTDSLEPVGATEAHGTSSVTESQTPIHQGTPNAGLGIASSTLTLTPSQKPSSPILYPGSKATDEELEDYVSKQITSTHARRTEPLRRSLVVQQNLCSHTKLQHMLGIEPTTGPTTNGNHRSRSPRHHTQSPSMTMNEVLSPMKRENDRLGFVKKGSMLFREKRTNLTSKVKAGWKVRPEEWQDDDDRN
ncbi:MAG: hypothetical protein Q9169_000292 [Polycauliona sp. 2 TL-2023]